MKRIVLLVFAISLVAVPSAAAKKPPSFALWTAKWKAQTDALKQHGEQGWELVSLCPDADVKGQRDGHLMIFKRPVEACDA